MGKEIKDGQDALSFITGLSPLFETLSWNRTNHPSSHHAHCLASCSFPSSAGTCQGLLAGLFSLIHFNQKINQETPVQQIIEQCGDTIIAV